MRSPPTLPPAQNLNRALNRRLYTTVYMLVISQPLYRRLYTIGWSLDNVKTPGVVLSSY